MPQGKKLHERNKLGHKYSIAFCLVKMSSSTGPGVKYPELLAQWRHYKTLQIHNNYQCFRNLHTFSAIHINPGHVIPFVIIL